MADDRLIEAAELMLSWVRGAAGYYFYENGKLITRLAVVGQVREALTAAKAAEPELCGGCRHLITHVPEQGPECGWFGVEVDPEFDGCNRWEAAQAEEAG